MGSDDSSKDAAIAGVDAAVSDAVAAGSADASKAFTLTTGRDDFVGGSGDDSFDATATALSAGDELDGGDGTDTLTIADNVGGLNIAMPSVTVKNIENLVLTTTVLSVSLQLQVLLEWMRLRKFVQSLQP